MRIPDQVLPAEDPLIPVVVGQIGDSPAQVCDGRTLHAFLQNGDLFANWIRARIEKYGFVQDQDFAIALESTKAKRGGHNRVDYYLSLDMAKELCMVENNPRGREARRYFIAMERQALAAAAGPLPVAPAPTPVAPDATPVETRPTVPGEYESFVLSWWVCYRAQPVRVRDLLGVVRPHVLARLCGAATREAQATVLGRLLRAWSGQTVGRFRICERAALDHQGPQWHLEPTALVRPVPARLPPPRDPAYLPGVRRAINRRAQQLSRDCFRQRRQAIDAWLRQHCQSETPAAVIARIAQLQLADLADGAAEMPRSGSHGAAPGASPRSADLPAPGYYTGARPSALPFVADLGMWCVPPATSFTAAHARGVDYAQHVAAYLRDNREFVGGNLLFQILRAIVASGGFADDGPDKGYAAGFCSGIEWWAVVSMATETCG